MESNKAHEPNEKLLFFRKKVVGIHNFLIASYIVLGLTVLLFNGNVFVPIVLLFPAFIHYLAILGLKGNRLWGRTLSMFIAFFLLIAFPIGTIFGGFLLYYLTSKEWHEWHEWREQN